MKFLTLLALASGAASIVVACSAPDPQFIDPSASRGHSGTVGGSTSGSGSSSGSGGAGTGSSGSGSSSGSSTGSSGGSSGAAGDAGGGSSGGDGGLQTAATYGTPCTTNADCSGSAYNSCQLIQQANICTKSCGTNADCPAPPTGGTCNANGYCK